MTPFSLKASIIDGGHADPPMTVRVKCGSDFDYSQRTLLHTGLVLVIKQLSGQFHCLTASFHCLNRKMISRIRVGCVTPFSLKATIIDGGHADPPMTVRSKCGRAVFDVSMCASSPCQIVGTPANQFKNPSIEISEQSKNPPIDIFGGWPTKYVKRHA